MLEVTGRPVPPWNWELGFIVYTVFRVMEQRDEVWHFFSVSATKWENMDRKLHFEYLKEILNKGKDHDGWDH